jgi:hypothetical protein
MRTGELSRLFEQAGRCRKKRKRRQAVLNICRRLGSRPCGQGWRGQLGRADRRRRANRVGMSDRWASQRMCRREPSIGVQRRRFRRCERLLVLKNESSSVRLSDRGEGEERGGHARAVVPSSLLTLAQYFN